jgi:hypothetical protein
MVDNQDVWRGATERRAALTRPEALLRVHPRSNPARCQQVACRNYGESRALTV